eukprot:g9407.t1
MATIVKKGPHILCATSYAPTNIACIKYWGKRDASLNLPINSSVSITLDMDDLRTVTSVTASSTFKKDRLWLNGNEEDPEKNKRVQKVLSEIRKRITKDVVINRNNSETVTVSASDLKTYGVHIISYNTFPTAAGLASSASGYACMVHALSNLFNVEETFEGELTTIARQGSGSACRSLYSGFVKWKMGSKVDGTDSIAVQVAKKADWKNMEAIICVVSDKKKDVGSTGGMASSVKTSKLLKHRAECIVDERLEKIEKAYLKNDFETFGRITMQDSNQFHATCLDSFPPIFYMNDVSRDIIQLVHKYNEMCGKIVAAYTFDAGPNAVIFVEKGNVPTLLKGLLSSFPSNDNGRIVSSLDETILKIANLNGNINYEDDENKFLKWCKNILGTKYLNTTDSVKQFIHTRVGDGASSANTDNATNNDLHLADEFTGLPKEQYWKGGNLLNKKRDVIAKWG